jgi:hypothetical protein
MSKIAWHIASNYLWPGAAAVALMCTSAVSEQNATPPDFGSDNTGWVSIGTDYVGVPGGAQPVTFDPAHRYVPNGSDGSRRFGSRTSTIRC